MLIIILIPATALAIIWLYLLAQVTAEDWKTAAYNKVLDNRLEIEYLHQKDSADAKRLSKYHGVPLRVMSVIIGSGSEKKIQQLERKNEQLQNGNLSSVNIFSMPGYALQRRVEAIGLGSLHRTIFSKYAELYGRKYAPNKTKQLLAQLLSYPIIGVALSLTLGALMVGMGNDTAGLAGV